MGRPATRSELLERAERDFETIFEMVEGVDAVDRVIQGACDRWSVKDILAHLDAWHELFLVWERVGSTGAMPDLPAEGYTWKETPALNDAIWHRSRDDAYEDVLARLSDSHRRITDVIAGYEEEALFTKGRYRWTGSTSIGSYAVSATTSHYDWASKLIRRFAKSRDTSKRPL